MLRSESSITTNNCFAVRPESASYKARKQRERERALFEERSPPRLRDSRSARLLLDLMHPELEPKPGEEYVFLAAQNCGIGELLTGLRFPPAIPL